MCFFIGGDNYMAPSNGITKNELRDILKKIDSKTGVTLKAGVGISKYADKAADLADLGLEDIRADLTDDSVLVFHD
jgi:GTP cyclohydrolase IIa